MEQPRLFYLDKLRSLAVLLVVAMHAAVTYSGIGGWYYKEGVQETLSILELCIFGALQSFTQAWFLGALFFVSAFFAARSLKKRGPGAFLRERLFRLGIPLLFYMFVIAPLIYFVILGEGRPEPLLARYGQYLISFRWIGSTGPLWFSEALLIFCALYALLRRLRPVAAAPQGAGTRLGPRLFGDRGLICLMALTALAAFLVRLVFPIGSSVLNLQFSFFSSYIVLFVLGIIAGEGELIEAVSGPGQVKWFVLALAAGIPLWFVVVLLGGVLEGRMFIYGGPHWQSLAYAAWESFVAIGFSVGLMGFLKKYGNRSGLFSQALGENAFGIYVFHAPVLVTVSMMMKGWHAAPFLKFAAAALSAALLSLGVSMILRTLGPLRRLLR